LQDAIPATCSTPNTTDQSGQNGQGTDCRPDLTAAATTLGITVEELQAALMNGNDQGRPQGGPDFTAAATVLGITEDALKQALQDAKPTDCATPTTIDQNGQPAQNTNCRPDLAAAATALGITTEELQAALGGPSQNGPQGGPDFTAAATTLGISEDALKQALQDAKSTDCTATNNGSTPNGKCRPDLATAATTLGVTTEELQSALGVPPQGQGPQGQGQPGGQVNGQQPPTGGQQAP
jgi:hypothetical protein